VHEEWQTQPIDRTQKDTSARFVFFFCSVVSFVLALPLPVTIAFRFESLTLNHGFMLPSFLPFLLPLFLLLFLLLSFSLFSLGGLSPGLRQFAVVR
jgi:hypothetical protein